MPSRHTQDPVPSDVQSTLARHNRQPTGRVLVAGIFGPICLQETEEARDGLAVRRQKLRLGQTSACKLERISEACAAGRRCRGRQVLPQVGRREFPRYCPAPAQLSLIRPRLGSTNRYFENRRALNIDAEDASTADERDDGNDIDRAFDEALREEAGMLPDADVDDDSSIDDDAFRVTCPATRAYNLKSYLAL